LREGARTAGAPPNQRGELLAWARGSKKKGRDRLDVGVVRRTKILGFNRKGLLGGGNLSQIVETVEKIGGGPLAQRLQRGGEKKSLGAASII